MKEFDRFDSSKMNVEDAIKKAGLDDRTIQHMMQGGDNILKPEEVAKLKQYTERLKNLQRQDYLRPESKTMRMDGLGSGPKPK